MKKVERRSNPAHELRISGSGKLEGYAALFNTLSEDLGGFREKIAPGAFKKSLSGDVRCLFNHSPDMVLGRTTSGTLRLNEDFKGLHISCTPPKTTWANDLSESIRRRDISQMSFGFRVISDSWESRGSEKIRILRQVELIDVSPVTFPAYPQTTVEARQNRSVHSMNPELKKLYDERMRVYNEMRRLHEANDNEAYRKAEDDFDRLSREIKFAETEQMFKEPVSEPIKPMPEKAWRKTEDDFNDEDAIRVFGPGEQREYLMARIAKLKEQREIPVWNSYLQKGLLHLSTTEKKMLEQRAIQLDSDTQAGFSVAPELFVNQFIVGLGDAVFLRRYATVLQCRNAHSLGAPALDNDISDPVWGAELSSGGPDTSLSLEKRVLYPHPLARRILCSNTLIRRNPAVSDLVRSRMIGKFAVVEEANFIGGVGQLGNGAGRPLGLMTVSENGINSDRDISTHNTTTEIKPDNLIECKYTLKAQYRNRARWIFSRAAVKQLRKAKLGTGEYIWQPGISSGRPDTILDMPYDESEYMPDTFTSGSLVGILGDMSFFYIVDAMDMQIRVADQLYLESDQTGFFGRRETDAMPVLSEAFVRVKLA
jgi:HK97 family phage major capsid protein/HK97 family phage prohead protease